MRLFDVRPSAGTGETDARVKYIVGDLCDAAAVRAAVKVRAWDLPFSTSQNIHTNDLAFPIIPNRNDLHVRQGVDCVFHVASYGMSGKEMLDVAKTRAACDPHSAVSVAIACTLR